MFDLMPFEHVNHNLDRYFDNLEKTFFRDFGGPVAGIRAVHGRAEDLGKNREYREQFDFCVSRAVANLSTLSEYCIPFVKTGGFFIPYKSGKSQEEISEAEGAVLHLGGKMEGTVFETLPNSEAERAFVLIKKVSATPKKYPRKAGTPSRDPIS